MASVVIQEAGQDPKLYNLDREIVVIGRQRDAELRLSNISVSRRHARIVTNEEGIFIEDLGSQNGIQLNGQPTQRQRLKTGDEVQVGKFMLLFFGDERTQLDHEYEGRPIAQIPCVFGFDTGAMRETSTFQLTPAMISRMRQAARLSKQGRVVRDGGYLESWAPGNETLRIGGRGDIEAKGFPWLIPVAAVAWNGNAHVLRRLFRWGTVKVNGQPVVERMLREDDSFQVAASGFRYVVVED